MGSEKQNGDTNPLDAIEQQARDWVLKQDQGLTAAEQDRFFDWLAADPRHSNAYSEMKGVWKDLDVFAQWRPEHSLTPNPNLLSQFRWRRFRPLHRAIAGIAACALLAIGLWSADRILNPVDAKPLSSVAAADYEKHTLEDGSLIELNSGAQISVNYSKTRRGITLISGEAYFTVAKDPSRPFIVQAGDVAVEAIGTAFNVDRDADQIEVLVTEGQILLESPIFQSLSVTKEKPAKARRALNAGEITVVPSRISLETPKVEQFSSSQIVKRLAWKAGLLEFTESPLSTVVSAFNRYNETQIVIGDEALTSLKVSAALRPNDLEAFTQLLELTLPVSSERRSESEIVLSKRL